MTPAWGPWRERKYFLDKMSLGDLVVAFFTHYSIIAYLAVAAVGIGLAVYLTEQVWTTIASVVVVAALYPLVEYLVHRFVLHSQLYKLPFTAKVWKRIHYDHHQNPHDLSVLFAALYTTMPTIILIATPIGWLVGGPAGVFAAIATASLIFTGYEFCHCVQHLPFTPRLSWLREIKKRHLAHHFHSEQGNYGITSGIWDKAFGTLYEHAREIPKSSTAYNLGYTGEERERYPWVGELSASEEEYAARRTRRIA
jgi:sterol desaturase/sphingolipid hydroxylase (fatty acid hydroxylase superfamily)